MGVQWVGLGLFVGSTHDTLCVHREVEPLMECGS